MPEHDHPMRRTLQRDVFPYFVSARQLRRQWFYRLHMVFGYTTDLVVAMAAVGVSAPILSLLGSVAEAGSDSDRSESLWIALSSVPSWLYWPMAVFVVVWIFLRVAFNREEGQKRAVLAKSCSQQLRQAEAALHGVMGKPNPMADVTELLELRIRPTVDRSIQENAWPWTPFAPNIDDEVETDVAALCVRYESDWETVDSEGLRKLPAGGDL